MDDKDPAAGGIDCLDKMLEVFVLILVVNADAGLDGDRYLHLSQHGGHTIGYQRRLCHQARAYAARLDPVAGAADIQVDLLVAGVFHQSGAGAQGSGVIAAKLQGAGLIIAVAQEFCHITIHQCPRRQHLGVHQRIWRQQAQQITTVAIGTTHHGCQAQGAVQNMLWAGLQSRVFRHG